jgi:MEDS: MEthanogen/methylotroph, DcmR Sensory domain
MANTNIPTRAVNDAHVVQFFETEDHLIAEAGRFVEEGIESGCTCVVIASPARSEGIDAQLRASGLNPAALGSDYRYIALDARSILATFMSEGRPDQQRFHQNMGLLVRQASAGGKAVRVFGDLAALLAQEGQWDAVIQVEELWNELSRQHSFTLFCACPLAAFSDGSCDKALVCALHSHVIQPPQ